MPELILSRYTQTGMLLRTQLYAEKHKHVAWSMEYNNQYHYDMLGPENPTMLVIVAQRTFCFRRFDDFLATFGNQNQYHTLYRGGETANDVMQRMQKLGIVEVPIPTEGTHA